MLGRVNMAQLNKGGLKAATRRSSDVAEAPRVALPDINSTPCHRPLIQVLSSPRNDEITIGGHRGMGENLIATTQQGRPLLRYRENTIRSFNTAAAAGASFVEFDVQVTSDGVPVIWHDDSVLTFSDASGVPRMHSICEITLEEFKQLCPPQSTQLAPVVDSALVPAQENGYARHESHAAASTSEKCTGDLARFFNTDKGQRQASASSWAVSEDDELPTLAEVFKAVDPSVGFDIEVKMATPADMAVTPPQEVERMVGPILAAVQAVATFSSRPIVFSSFDPEICRALRQRQGRFPVLFLSTGGTCWHADERRMSIAAAVGFALEANLQGLVLDSGAVQQQPQAVALARSKGLKVLTYGLQNNDPYWVRSQYCLGVQGAIVDDVAGVISAFGRPQSVSTVEHA